MKIEIPEKWHFNLQTGGLEFYRHDFIEESDLHDPDKQPKPAIVLGRRAYFCLLEYIKEHEKDVVKTDRTEDLKIIHRLLNVLEKTP